MRSASPAELLDVHADADHNRSVFTLVGDEDDLVDALLAGVACARDRIDLRRHEGAHPRVGAADVVPVVPIVPDDMPRAQETATDGRAAGSAASSACPSSSTASSRPVAGRRSSGAVARRSFSGGSTRAS